MSSIMMSLIKFEGRDSGEVSADSVSIPTLLCSPFLTKAVNVISLQKKMREIISRDELDSDICYLDLELIAGEQSGKCEVFQLRDD